MYKALKTVRFDGISCAGLTAYRMRSLLIVVVADLYYQATFVDKGNKENVDFYIFIYMSCRFRTFLLLNLVYK